MQGIEVGSVVRLKSGGPKMTVEEVRAADLVKCTWFDCRMVMATSLGSEVEVVEPEFLELRQSFFPTQSLDLVGEI